MRKTLEDGDRVTDRTKDRTKVGRCRLTGDQGPFVRSHIIPRALSNRSPGTPHLQIGEELPSSRRRDAWYDWELVTRTGENILAALDDWAIRELRRLKLVWSGWGPIQTLEPDIPSGTDWGLRDIVSTDGARLRVFFLSILWRAAASNLPEMAEITLRASDLRRLARLVREGDPGSPNLFPITLTQITDRGPNHNMAPVARGKRGFKYSEFVASERRIFRFYFDGLAIQFDRDGDDDLLQRFGPMIIGNAPNIVVSTVSYRRSWQRERMATMLARAASIEPDRIAGYASANAIFAGSGRSSVDLQPQIDLSIFNPLYFSKLAEALRDK